MKTQEQKIKHVMEAAGECWNKNKKWSCAGVSARFGQDNPSPDDLNELVRLAEKLFGTKSKVSFYPSRPCGLQCAAIYPTGLHAVGTDSGNNKAEALLNALFIATGGKDG